MLLDPKSSDADLTGAHLVVSKGSAPTDMKKGFWPRPAYSRPWHLKPSASSEKSLSKGPASANSLTKCSDEASSAHVTAGDQGTSTNTLPSTPAQSEPTVPPSTSALLESANMPQPNGADAASETSEPNNVLHYDGTDGASKPPQPSSPGTPTDTLTRECQDESELKSQSTHNNAKCGVSVKVTRSSGSKKPPPGAKKSAALAGPRLRT